MALHCDERNARSFREERVAFDRFLLNCTTGETGGQKTSIHLFGR